MRLSKFVPLGVAFAAFAPHVLAQIQDLTVSSQFVTNAASPANITPPPSTVPAHGRLYALTAPSPPPVSTLSLGASGSYTDQTAKTSTGIDSHSYKYGALIGYAYPVPAGSAPGTSAPWAFQFNFDEISTYSAPAADLADKFTESGDSWDIKGVFKGAIPIQWPVAGCSYLLDFGASYSPGYKLGAAKLTETDTTAFLPEIEMKLPPILDGFQLSPSLGLQYTEKDYPRPGQDTLHASSRTLMPGVTFSHSLGLPDATWGGTVTYNNTDNVESVAEDPSTSVNSSTFNLSGNLTERGKKTRLIKATYFTWQFQEIVTTQLNNKNYNSIAYGLSAQCSF